MIVNRIAGCALGCYLLQDGMFGQTMGYKIFQEIWVKGDLSQYFFSISIAFFLIWASSYALTYIANLWIPPVTQWFCRKFKKLNNSIDKLSV